MIFHEPIDPGNSGISLAGTAWDSTFDSASDVEDGVVVSANTVTVSDKYNADERTRFIANVYHRAYDHQAELDLGFPWLDGSYENFTPPKYPFEAMTISFPQPAHDKYLVRVDWNEQRSLISDPVLDELILVIHGTSVATRVHKTDNYSIFEYRPGAATTYVGTPFGQSLSVFSPRNVLGSFQALPGLRIRYRGIRSSTTSRISGLSWPTKFSRRRLELQFRMRNHPVAADMQLVETLYSKTDFLVDMYGNWGQYADILPVWAAPGSERLMAITDYPGFGVHNSRLNAGPTGSFTMAEVVSPSLATEISNA